MNQSKKDTKELGSSFSQRSKKSLIERGHSSKSRKVSLAQANLASPSQTHTNLLPGIKGLEDSSIKQRLDINQIKEESKK